MRGSCELGKLGQVGRQTRPEEEIRINAVRASISLHLRRWGEVRGNKADDEAQHVKRQFLRWEEGCCGLKISAIWDVNCLIEHIFHLQCFLDGDFSSPFMPLIGGEHDIWRIACVEADVELPSILLATCPPDFEPRGEAMQCGITRSKADHDMLTGGVCSQGLGIDRWRADEAVTLQLKRIKAGKLLQSTAWARVIGDGAKNDRRSLSLVVVSDSPEEARRRTLSRGKLNHCAGARR